MEMEMEMRATLARGKLDCTDFNRPLTHWSLTNSLTHELTITVFAM